MKIAIVEDDGKIARELALFLQRNGYETVIADDFTNAAESILKSGADLALLDLNLPGADGCAICRALRKQSAIPVIMVTSSDNEIDELSAMNMGADDYITKPYNAQILLLRMQAVLKRAYPAHGGSVLSGGGITLNLSRSEAVCGVQRVELSRNEARILETLLRAGEAIVSRDALMDALWQTDQFVDENTLTVNVNRLRKKLAGIGAPEAVKTHRGQGYSL